MVTSTHYTAHEPAEAVAFGARLSDQSASVVLELCGECDIASDHLLEPALTHALHAARERGSLVVDVSQLSFCDAHSAGLVMKASTTIRTVLSGAHGTVKRVFDLIDPSHDLARAAGPLDGTHHPDHAERSAGLSEISRASTPSAARTIAGRRSRG